MNPVILFDMDGVLMNTEVLHYAIWQQVFAERGLTIDFERYKGCIGSTNARLMELIYEGYGVDFRGDESVIQRFSQLNQEHIRLHGVPPIEGVAQTLAQLKTRGYRMAVASSSSRKNIEMCLQSLQIQHFFEVLFSAEQVARPKPAPDVFLAAAAAMDAPPETCVVVEDSTAGVAAGRAAGMRVLGVDRNQRAPQDFAGCEWLVHDLSELDVHAVFGDSDDR